MTIFKILSIPVLGVALFLFLVLIQRGGSRRSLTSLHPLERLMALGWGLVFWFIGMGAYCRWLFQ